MIGSFGRVDLIFDVGKTLLGVESTVLDLTEGVPVILRPGGVRENNLKKTGPVELDFGAEP